MPGVDFVTVSTEGLESSPVATQLAGLRANEARYFKNKHDHDLVVVPAAQAAAQLAYVDRILAEERGLRLSATPLQVSEFVVEGVRWTYVFYQDGLALNVLYTLAPGGKRAVGFKLSDGMEIPAELAAAGFKFARQRSKLAGTIRGSFFVVKHEY